MTDIEPFALLVVLVAAVGLLALLSSRLSQLIRIPSPALVLVGAAIAVKIVPALHAPSQHAVGRVVTVALACILFDGGMRMGWARFRQAARPIAAAGLLGTFATAAAVAAGLHYALGAGWYVALLVATAIAPTDPAMVFSVLGQREISGRSGTILEGESGANDPVGIALMTALIAAGGLSWPAVASVGAQFAVQMAAGAAIGLAGGLGLLWFARRVSLPGEGLYSLRMLAGALLVYGLATLAHGSGFLAVFIAGLVLSDQPAPYKREIERFHNALASLAEIIAFAALGLTVNLSLLSQANVWVPGLVTGAAVAFVIRPVLVGACLAPARLAAGERAFVLFAGLKGAVPILLGSYLLVARIPGAQRFYAIVAVVVIFSVVVQGSLIPAAAARLRVPMRPVEPRPFALGVRLGDEPEDVQRLTIRPGAPADGATVGSFPAFAGPAWVSLVVRDGQLLPITSDTILRGGDDVLILADPALRPRLTAALEGPPRSADSPAGPTLTS